MHWRVTKTNDHICLIKSYGVGLYEWTARRKILYKNDITLILDCTKLQWVPVNLLFNTKKINRTMVLLASTSNKQSNKLGVFILGGELWIFRSSHFKLLMHWILGKGIWMLNLNSQLAVWEIACPTFVSCLCSELETTAFLFRWTELIDSASKQPWFRFSGHCYPIESSNTTLRPVLTLKFASNF